MRALASQLSQTIYSKTQKGREEMTQRRFGLDMRQRRILILMDGRKNLATIQEMVGDDDLGNIISMLLEQGFIASGDQTLRKTAEPTVPPVAQRSVDSETATPPLIQDPVKIREVKDFMTTTATTYLGLLGAEIIRHIERADDAAQLMTVLGPWHMALCESKQGHRFAGPYLVQITAALTGNDELHEAM